MPLSFPWTAFPPVFLKIALLAPKTKLGEKSLLSKNEATFNGMIKNQKN